MSQPGEAAPVRASTSPASLKRKRDLADHSHPSWSPEAAFKMPKLANGTPSHANHSRFAVNASTSKQYLSPDSDANTQHHEGGDMLQGGGSASSLTSAGSSVFSHSSNSAANHRSNSLANGYTPLTNLSESSPPEGATPRATNAATDSSFKQGVFTTSNIPASYITPEASQPHTARLSMFPPPGTAKGYRAVWDPELDGRLSKEERKRATMRRKEFGLEVRYKFHNLLSLRKIIQIT